VFLQSLDYDICENHLLLEEERTKGYKFIVKKNFARWFIFLLIGMLTALIACIIDITVEEVSHIKFNSLKKCILCINISLACGSFSYHIINLGDEMKEVDVVVSGQVPVGNVL
jgi:ABC-type Fe3+-siderophore transport system permease subunit